MTDEDKTAWMRNAAVLSAAVFGLKAFAIKILTEISPNDEIVTKIRNECVLELKNTDVFGLSINQEAEFLGQAIKVLEQLLDMTIADWKKEIRDTPSSPTTIAPESLPITM